MFFKLWMDGIPKCAGIKCLVFDQHDILYSSLCNYALLVIHPPFCFFTQLLSSIHFRLFKLLFKNLNCNLIKEVWFFHTPSERNHPSQGGFLAIIYVLRLSKSILCIVRYKLSCNISFAFVFGIEFLVCQ